MSCDLSEPQSDGVGANAFEFTYTQAGAITPNDETYNKLSDQKVYTSSENVFPRHMSVAKEID